MHKIKTKNTFRGQKLLLLVVLPLVFLGYLFASYPSNAADGDTTSTTSTVIDTSTGLPTSTVVDTTTSTSSNPISTNTEITNTTTTLEDFGGGITEQTTIDTHTTTNVDDVTTTTTQAIDTSTPVTTTTTNTTNTTTENHTSNTNSSNYLGNPGFETEENTGNPSNWTATGNVTVGDTCGPFGGNCLKTGNETRGGGTVSQTVDLFDQMTQAEINHGFTVKYGSQVNSHISNATVPVCGNTTGDCKDSFSITLDIKDSSGTLLHKFEHEFTNITWTGWNTTDFFFNSTVPSNNYTSSLATLELYGIDSGFGTGSFGPQFDNAIVQTVYTAIDFVVNQTIDTIISTQNDVVRSYAVSSATDRVTTITNEDISTVVTIVAPIEVETPDIGMDIVEVEVETNMEDIAGGTEIESFEVTVTDNAGSTIDSFEVTTETNLDTGLTEISIEPIEVEMPTTTETVAEVETQIEAQVEAQVEEVKAETTPGGLKPDSQQAETEPESEGDPRGDQINEPKEEAKTEVAESEQEESNSETKTAKAEPKEESDKKDQGGKSKAKASAKNKEEVKKEVATRIVSRIISKLSDDAASQGTQLALMNIIGADITKNSPNLQDKKDWYINPVIYTAELRDPYARLFSIAQDRLHEQLTDLQYN
jgi:hypothetical protein